MNDERVHRASLLSEQLLSIIVELILKQKNDKKFLFDDIKPPIEIDKIYLNHFISLFEQRNTPIAYLTCGLLLDGHIETTAMLVENCAAYDEYIEKRIHDAISFYIKATEDPFTKPIAEFLVWDLKITCPLQSVQERLLQYDIVPSNFFKNYKEFSGKRAGVVVPLSNSFTFFNSLFKSQIEDHTPIDPS